MINKIHSALIALIATSSLAACDSGGSSSVEDENMSRAVTAENDPYLWLEEVEGERALEWVRAQNDRSVGELEADSRYGAFLDEAMAILTSNDRIPGAALRGGYAYNFWQDENHVRGIWRRMPMASYVGGGSDWEVVLDVDALADAEDENWVYEGTNCLAPSYTKCMVTLSRGGSDAAVRREYDIATETFVDGGFELPEAKAGTAWMTEDTLLMASDFGEGSVTASGYPRQVRLWQRGVAPADAPVIFEGEESDVGIWPFTVYADGEYRGFIVRSMTFYDSIYYTVDSETGETTALPFPEKSDFTGFINGSAIISLNEPWEINGETFAMGAVVSYDMATGAVSSIFSPTGQMAVQGASASENAVFVSVLDNIQGRVLRFDPTPDGWAETAIDLPENGTVSISAIDDESGDFIVYYENPTTPETQYYVPFGGAPQALRATPAFYETDGVVTRQYEAISTDGTRIPYFVTAKQSVLDAGPAPTIQYGYGGFQISILPTYSGTTGKLWIENGGVYVTANIRGGGEFGPGWHQAGLKTERQHIYDDFFAVSESLIAEGITTSDQLGILGGSNGGLLMGVSMVQRPDLYSAIGIGVPLLDMLRFDQLLAGASWVGEYGSPSIPEERAFLESISPYHNVDPAADYPRPYFFTSTKDDRVHPGHARKMARLMEEYEMPFLYYENIEGGHGAAANLEQSARRLALQYVYFATALGLE